MDGQTAGWDSITKAFEKQYPGQEPLHYGTLISWRLGGDNPLDGISVYDGGGFYHFVTLGFSELYEKEAENKEWSGYGFELTVKLKKAPGMEDELGCMAGILQAVARYVFQEGAAIGPYEYIYTGQREGMDSKGQSKLTGFITAPDEMGDLDTPNGRLEFVQLVGATDHELVAVQQKQYTVKQLLERLGHTLTDYSRDDIL